VSLDARLSLGVEELMGAPVTEALEESLNELESDEAEFEELKGADEVAEAEILAEADELVAGGAEGGTGVASTSKTETPPFALLRCPPEHAVVEKTPKLSSLEAHIQLEPSRPENE